MNAPKNMLCWITALPVISHEGEVDHGSPDTCHVKVLHVAETIKGGVATYLANLNAGADEIGGEFHYLIPESQCSELQCENVHFHQAGRSLRGIFHLATRLLDLQRKLRADVVFAHSTYAGLALTLAKPFLGRRTRTFYCPHGWALFREMSIPVRFLVRTVERMVSHAHDAVVNISNFEHDTVRRLGFSKRCILITNAVCDNGPCQDVQPHRDKPLRVLFVGRFDRQKGIDILFDAITRLDDGVEFDIVGDRVLAPRTEFEAPMQDNIRYHGWLAAHQLGELYAMADILVMPSRWEGFGLCAIEAFRAGTPVLARTVGALPEIVRDGYNGYLFDGDGEALAKKLSTIRRAHLAPMRINARREFDDKYRVESFYMKHRKLLNVTDKSEKCLGD